MNSDDIIPKTYNWGSTGTKPRKPLAWVRDSGCIICTSHATGDHGYPQVLRDGKVHRLSRYILFRKYGSQQTSIHSRHTCDNRRCINPDHIISGTNYDNVRDRCIRNRTALADTKIQTRLTIEKASEIKRLLREHKLSFVKIGKLFGISPSSVCNIKIGRAWKYAP